MAELTAKVKLDLSDLAEAEKALAHLQETAEALQREIAASAADIAAQRRQLAELRTGRDELRQGFSIPAHTLSAQCPQCTRTVGFSVEAVTQGLLVYCCVCDTYYRVGLHLEKGRPNG